MRQCGKYRSGFTDQHGASAVLIAIVLVMLIGFAALAVDIGYLYATRSELQNVADAAALAAARKLGELYQAMPPNLQSTYDLGNFPSDKTAIEAVAINLAAQNQAAGKTIAVPIADIEIGQWDFIGRTLSVTSAQPDAVRVTARRDNVANGPITTFFAKVWNVQDMTVNATATAALSGLGQTDTGDLVLPIGISQFWFNNPVWCDDTIKFSPTKDPDACAGWNSFTYSPPNDNRLRDILQEDPMYQSPPTQAGATSFNFIGGDLSQNSFNDLLLLYMKYGYDVKIDGHTPVQTTDGTPDGPPVTGPLPDPTAGTVPLNDSKTGDRLYYPDGKNYKDFTPRNKHVWETFVVVYDWNNCDNPNTAIKIVGYAPVRVRDIYDAGKDGKMVFGQVVCNKVDPDDVRGGGAYFGLKGPIPGLVQ